MKKIIPDKLRINDEVRVIAPSRSMGILSDETIDIAVKTLESLGLKVTFGEYVNDSIDDDYNSSSIENRVKDLMDAFKDPNVKAILTVIGGFNVNQILDYIDYEVIRNNPKILCGYSDITALLESITARTGLVTYYGPHFSTFGIKLKNEYTVDYFNKMVFANEVVKVEASHEWSNDLWFIDQDKRDFINNDGFNVISEGAGEGVILGGNLCTLNLLQGTPYFPKIDEDIILFIEDDGGADANFLVEFDRNFQSLIHALDKDKIKGIVVGRAELNCKMTVDKWKKIFVSKGLGNIPIILNADFGHTNPMITIPLTGYAKIDTSTNTIEIRD